MRDSAWAGMGGRYDLQGINYDISVRRMAIAAHTQRLLTDDNIDPRIDLPAAIAWQNEMLQDLLTTKQMMEKANERANQR